MLKEIQNWFHDLMPSVRTEFKRISSVYIRDDAITQTQFHALVDTTSVVEVEWDPFSTTSAAADQLGIEDED